MVRARPVAALVLLAVVGAAPASTPDGVAASARVTVERVSHGAWDEAFRLSNGTVEAVVVPAVARVLSYGFVGEESVLWTNETVAGRPASDTQWVNYGGDKLWVWPQADWPRFGRGWPPPTDRPGVIGHRAEVVEGPALRLTSEVVPGLGVRLVRDVRLAPEGTRLTLADRVEKVGDDAARPLAAWTVTQLPADGRIFGRQLPGARGDDGYRLFSEVPFAAVTPVGADILQFVRPTDTSAKLGLDGDLLAWERAGLLMTILSVVPGGPLQAYPPGDRAQVFTRHDYRGDNPELPPGTSYVELEFTGPPRVLAAGEGAALTTVWELTRLPEDERSAEAVAARLRADPR